MESRQEKLFLLLTRRVDQFLNLRKLLSDGGWRVKLVDDVRSLDGLVEQGASDRQLCLAILETLDRVFSRQEIILIRDFATKFGSLLVAGSEIGDKDTWGNLNKIISQFGVKFNSDCVVRPNLYKHFHPKDALLEDFVVNRGFDDVLRKHLTRGATASAQETFLKSKGIGSGPRIIYARGCTLSVSKKSAIAMTSSRWVLPGNQAICSLYRGSENKLKVVAIGSSSLFSDRFIDEEDNRALVKTILEFIEDRNFPINLSDAKTIEIPECNMTPDIKSLAELPIYSFRKPEELPEDKSSLINRKLFKIDNSMLPKLLEAYRKLNVSRGPLTLIKPEISRVALELEPATHGCLLRKLNEK